MAYNKNAYGNGVKFASFILGSTDEYKKHKELKKEENKRITQGMVDTDVKLERRNNKSVKFTCAHCGAEIKTGLSCPKGCTNSKSPPTRHDQVREKNGGRR